ncbi:sulfatase-like hydrolase/transferase [Methylomicrobium lacus]|uniref:sulfatase-like hydrolase/transferase n=1 Tax=Methylomicrobium lacus TaxID=136992 RepID=UPI0035A8C29F
MSNYSFESCKTGESDGRHADLTLSLIIATLPIVLKIQASLFSDGLSAKVLPSILGSIADTPRLMLALLVFLLTILGCHLLVGYLAWRIWRPFAESLDCPVSRRRLLAVLFFATLQAAILGLNNLFFPHTDLQVAMPKMLVAMGGCSFFGVLLGHGKRRIGMFQSSHWRPGHVALMLASLLLGGFLVHSDAGRSEIAHRDQPDVIIIGLDSFRPDHLQQPGDIASITPNLDKFLRGAYRFERAYTPMARTYPAWMSILTGRYPIEHGARENLLDPKYLHDRERSLPFLLKNKSYITAYSIDETRFSNIDHQYGFDLTVTPEIGAADFVLATGSDLPLINFINLTPKLHAALFPYQFINRAVHKTYEPDNFDEQLDHLINTVDSGHPLFLVTHFELPHWPYDWRGSDNFTAPENQRLATLSPPDYQKAVHRADIQFGALLQSLRRNGRLNNAVVAVLSDHGEGFTNFAPVWKPEKNGKSLVLPPFDLHGGNVLDEAQTRVLLAFKRFGGNASLQGQSRRLTSLVDVAPTLLSLAGIDKQELNATGCDLFAADEDRPECSQERVVFTESGFNPPSLAEGNGLDPNKVAEEAYAYYDVNPDTRLTLKGEFLRQLFDDKQRAAISDHGIVVSMSFNGQKQLLYGDLIHHTYRNADVGGSTAKENSLLKRLCSRYAADNSDLNSFCLQQGNV